MTCLKVGRLLAAVSVLAGLLAVPVSADFVIDVDFTGEAQYQSAFDGAAETWQSLLGGYQNGVVIGRSSGSSATLSQAFTTVRINASVVGIDGAGGTLGQAGFTEFGFDQLGFKLATDGVMEFDSADISGLSASQLNGLILHEMSHVLGFGTLWADNGVYLGGSGEFTGANATAAWQTDFSQLGTPDVELQGGTGTANFHWNEVFQGASPTGITDSLGRDMRDELMTGWLNPNSFISDLTIASFRDIGFTGATAVPEPGSMVVLMSLIGVYGVRRVRQRAGVRASVSA